MIGVFSLGNDLCDIWEFIDWFPFPYNVDKIVPSLYAMYVICFGIQRVYAIRGIIFLSNLISYSYRFNGKVSF